MTDTTTAPEELAARVGWPHESGMRLCGEKDIAAAIRSHSAPLEAQIAELTAKLQAANAAYYDATEGISATLQADALEAAEAALAASQERERVMREYATATEYWKLEPHDQKERTAFLNRLAALQPQEPHHDR